MPKPILGLVGGIGSGKSEVAELFAARGGTVIAADAFGHEALRQPEILARVAERWGGRVLDGAGQVDRQKMASIVFASPVERTSLETLVFPWIEKRIREQIAAAQADPATAFIVLDAAIMMEAGWSHVCDQIVYVDAPAELRSSRLMTKRGWSPEEITRREAAQFPLTVKQSQARWTVDNSGSLDDTGRQTDAILKQLRK